MKTAADPMLILAGGQGSAELTAAADGKKLPRLELVAYTGGLMTVPGWGPVGVELAGLTIPAAAVPVLADHDSTRRGLVGHGVARVEGARLLVSGHVSASGEAAREIVEAARNGFPFQSSVGVEPAEVVEVKAGQKRPVNGTERAGPFAHVMRGRLREVSVVAMGADAGTSARVAAARRITVEPEKTVDMADREIGAEMERKRIAAIESACKGDWSIEAAAKVAEIRASAIAEGQAVAEVNAKLLEVLRASRPTAGAPVFIRGDGCDPREVLAAGLLLRCGRSDVALKRYGEKAVGEADRRGRVSLPDVLAGALAVAGVDLGQFRGNRSALIEAAFSSATLTNLLGDTLRSLLVPPADEQPPTWASFCKPVDLADFQTHKMISLRGQLGLQPIAPSGEIQHGILADRATEIALDTYARKVTITRKDALDDHLGGLADFAGEFRRAATAARSKLIYTVLLANAGSHFAGGNGNYISGGTSVLAATGLGLAFKAMRQQKGADSQPLDIQPAVLLVNETLEATALTLLSAELVGDGTVGGLSNIYRNKLRLEVEPRLGTNAGYSGGSDTLWFLLAGPSAAPMYTGYLNGKRAPTVESFGLTHDSDTLGLTFRAYEDMAAALGNIEAAVMSAGA